MDKAKLLEARIEHMNSDKKQAEKQLIENKENLEMEKIEITRLRTLLDNERSKVSIHSTYLYYPSFFVIFQCW